MTRLLDVNVLLALAWPTHEHHGVARKWFMAVAADGWATTPVVELGMVRIASNPRLSPRRLTPATAIDWLMQLRRYGSWRLIPDDAIDVIAPDIAAQLRGHNQVMDAHLLTLARANNVRLVTFDKALCRLAADDVEQL